MHPGSRVWVDLGYMAWGALLDHRHFGNYEGKCEYDNARKKWVRSAFRPAHNYALSFY